MWTVIKGFDYTNHIPIYGAGSGSAIQFQQTSNDPATSMDFDVQDDGSLFNFDIGDEVIVWNEDAPAYPGFAGHALPTLPSHNLVQLPNVGGTSNGKWFALGALSTIISPFPNLFPNMTFNNTPYSLGNNTGFLSAITPGGYVHVGQQYMFSVYVAIGTPLVNATCIVKMQFLDSGGTAIGSATSTSFPSTTNNTQQRIAISAIAPANAAFIQCWFGGQATVSGTNSGVIGFGTPQCEPMWFADTTRTSAHYPLTYPTPDCNVFQTSCATMPDGTTSRLCRFFSGTISDRKKEYLGRNRIWHITCAGPELLLEDGQINATYNNFTDAAILTDIVANYFATKISVNAANVALPSPIAVGVTLSSITYSDNSLKDVLNGLIGQSNYVYCLDQYYRLSYQPQFSLTAVFSLSDTPDNVSSFPYYAYTIDDDGTQLSRNIKIKGGNFSGTKQDIFSGDGVTKQFALTYIPDKITTLLVGSIAQRVGVYGRDTFNGSFDVLVNTQLQYILFNAAPVSGSNNVPCTYTYQAPISTTTTLSTNGIIAPSYTQSTFDAIVNDTNIVDLATATERGLSEIVQKGSPLTIITCNAQQYAPAGYCINFTSILDGIINQPFVVQSVKGSMIGTDDTMEPYNEFVYSLGDYQPTLVDHVKNSNKALNRSSTVANTTTAQQFDFVALEIIGYRDHVTAVPQPTFALGVYGNAGSKYGACSYGGMTGRYGSTAVYGMSTIYG